MRRLFSIFLLLILLTPALFKVSVKVYYEWNKEYIAANLCVNKDRPITMCYGKCFVDQKTQWIDQTPGHSGSLSQVTLDFSDFLISNGAAEKSVAIPLQDFPLAIQPSVTDGHSIAVFRPPLV